NLRIATTESYLDASNTRQERTEWHRVAIWGKRGEALAKFLKKGDRIFVEGGLRTSSYEKGGEKRYSTEIHAANVILAGGGKAPANEERKPAPAPAPASDFDFGGSDESDIPF